MTLMAQSIKACLFCMPRLNEWWKSIPYVMSVSPVLTGRIERCTGTHHMSYLAQRPREQLLKAERSRTDEDFTHPQSPAAASSSALTHTCRDSHTHWGYKKFGNMQNKFNRGKLMKNSQLLLKSSKRLLKTTREWLESLYHLKSREERVQVCILYVTHLLWSISCRVSRWKACYYVTMEAW